MKRREVLTGIFETNFVDVGVFVVGEDATSCSAGCSSGFGIPSFAYVLRQR